MKSWLKAAALGLLGAGSLVYARRIAPMQLDVTRPALVVYTLPPEFDGYRIAHFSDLHMDGLTMTRAHLEQVVEAINAEQPDLIAFTGDFITDRLRFQMADLIYPLRQLKARDGVVAVMGNHDHRVNTGAIRRVIRESGLIDLNNAVHVIQRGEARLYIAGVDSVLRHEARLDQVIPQIPEGSAAVLLAHEPDFADVSAATRRFAVQLSGHSHGGQIRIPVLMRLALPAYAHHYVQGVEQVNEMVLYTNRGLGTVGLPLRFRCPPELTMITLRALASLNR